jgi:hypothetical protein
LVYSYSFDVIGQCGITYPFPVSRYYSTADTSNNLCVNFYSTSYSPPDTANYWLPIWWWHDTLGTQYSVYQNTTICFDSIGSYYICLGVIDANGCDDDTCMLINIVAPSGISNHILNKFIEIYPNPTPSTLTIQNASGLYHLSEITGKTLLSGLASGETFTLDISTLSSGVYFLTLSEGGQQVARKVIKQ